MGPTRDAHAAAPVVGRGLYGDVAWFAAAQAVAGGLMLAYTFLAARLLGVRPYGTFQTLMGLHGLVMVFAGPLNLVTLHVVSGAAGPQRATARSALLRVAACFGVAAAAVTALAVVGMAPRLPAADLGITAAALAALVLAGSLLTTVYGDMQGANRYGRFAAAKLCEAGLAFAVGLTLLAAGAGVAGAVLGYLAGQGGVAAWWLWRHRGAAAGPQDPTPRPSLRGLRDPLLAFAAAGVVLNAPAVIAGVRLGADEAGAYGTLFALRNLALPFAFAVSLPLYSRVRAGLGRPVILRQAVKLCALFGVALAAVCALAGELLIRFLFGAPFTVAADHVAAYGVFLGLHGVAMVVLFHQAARGALRPWLLAGPAAVMVLLAGWPGLTVAHIAPLQIGAWAVYLVAAAASGRTARSSMDGAGHG